MDAAFRRVLVNEVVARIERHEFPICVLIPGTQKGLYGLNTNSVFHLLKASAQAHHSVLVDPVQFERARSARRSDVIVKWLEQLGTIWRVDFTGADMVLSVNRMPYAVLQRKLPELRATLETILKECHTVAKCMEVSTFQQ